MAAIIRYKEDKYFLILKEGEQHHIFTRQSLAPHTVKFFDSQGRQFPVPFDNFTYEQLEIGKTYQNYDLTGRVVGIRLQGQETIFSSQPNDSTIMYPIYRSIIADPSSFSAGIGDNQPIHPYGTVTIRLNGYKLSDIDGGTRSDVMQSTFFFMPSGDVIKTTSSGLTGSDLSDCITPDYHFWIERKTTIPPKETVQEMESYIRSASTPGRWHMVSNPKVITDLHVDADPSLDKVIDEFSTRINHLRDINIF